MIYLENYLQNRFIRFHIPDETLPLPLAFAIPSGDNDDNNNNNHGEQFQIGKTLK